MRQKNNIVMVCPSCGNEAIFSASEKERLSFFESVGLMYIADFFYPIFIAVFSIFALYIERFIPLSVLIPMAIAVFMLSSFVIWPAYLRILICGKCGKQLRIWKIKEIKKSLAG